MHPGNTVGNGTGVFSKDRHAHNCENNLELCYSKVVHGLGACWKCRISCCAPDPLNQNLHVNKISAVMSSFYKQWLRASYHLRPDVHQLVFYATLHSEQVFLMLGISGCAPHNPHLPSLPNPFWHVIARWILDLVGNEQNFSPNGLN